MDQVLCRSNRHASIGPRGSSGIGARLLSGILCRSESCRGLLNYKDDTRFQSLIDMGSSGEDRVCALFGSRSHELQSFDGGAKLGRSVTKDESVKRKRKSDLKCKECGLKVEVKTKSKFMVALSHSESRPFFKEHSPEDMLAIVVGTQVSLFSFADLIATQNQAIRKVNQDDEPYLVWDRGLVRTKGIPLCKH